MSPSKFCTTCGCRLDVGAVFCANCGLAVKTAVLRPGVAEASLLPNLPQEERAPIPVEAAVRVSQDEVKSISPVQQEQPPQLPAMEQPSSTSTESQQDSLHEGNTPQETHNLFESATDFEETENRSRMPIWAWVSIAIAILASVGGYFILHRPKQETLTRGDQHGSLSASSHIASDSSTMSPPSGTTENAKHYVFTKHWAIGNLPCNYLGGAYTFFDDQHGNVLVTQGKVQLPGAPTRVAY